MLERSHTTSDVFLFFLFLNLSLKCRDRFQIEMKILALDGPRRLAVGTLAHARIQLCSTTKLKNESHHVNLKLEDERNGQTFNSRKLPQREDFEPSQ